MSEWEEKLPPMLREKLAKIGEATPEEKERMKEMEKLDALLAEFYKGYLEPEDLWQKLKEYESQGKQYLLKEARTKLENSFRGKRLPIKFIEKNGDTLTVELLKEEEMEVPLVLELTDSNFSEMVKKYPLLVVDCWAPWCAPCRMVAPVIEELARDYQGKITFGKLNVDTNQLTAMKYRIMSIPTLLIFKNGELVDQKIGAMPRRMLEPEITKYLYN